MPESHNTTEVWKAVVGYEGVYEVSSLGRVKRVAPGGNAVVGRIRKPSDCHGYTFVALHRNGKRRPYRIHRLVMAAFIGPLPEGKQANHKNGDKTDNRPENLEYVTPSENRLHSTRILGKGIRQSHGNAKLRDHDIPAIRAHLAAGETLKAIGDRFGVTFNCINHIKHGRTWSSVHST